MQPGAPARAVIIRQRPMSRRLLPLRGETTARRPTLHHEDDIRVQRRVEEVNKSLGSELGRPGARSFSASLDTHPHTQTDSMKEKPEQ